MDDGACGTVYGAIACFAVVKALDSRLSARVNYHETRSSSRRGRSNKDNHTQIAQGGATFRWVSDLNANQMWGATSMPEPSERHRPAYQTSEFQQQITMSNQPFSIRIYFFFSIVGKGQAPIAIVFFSISFSPTILP